MNADQLISDHPAAVVLVFSVLWAALTWTWATLRWFVKREFAKLELHQERQDQEIGALRKDMDEYKRHFAVSQTSFDGLVEKLDAHIEKEDKLPMVVARIAEDVAWIKGRMKNGGS